MQQGNPELPGPSDRVLVVGRTGSGKTVAGLWLLSIADFDAKPWVIIDFKRDKQLMSIPGIVPLTLNDDPPTEPGLYILLADINSGNAVDDFLWKVYQQERVGLFADEGYMLGQGAQFSKPFRALLTQGRSKEVPIIINSQRPVWLDKFAKSEANKIIMFHLNDEKDRKTMAELIPSDDYDAKNPNLDKFQSYYYDIDNNAGVKLNPVPPPDASISLMSERLIPIQNSEIPAITSKITRI